MQVSPPSPVQACTCSTDFETAVKSFTSDKEARDFVNGIEKPRDPSLPDRWYAVARGRETGIFNDWKKVQQSITGTKMPSYKKFESRLEAVRFIERFGDRETIVKVGGTLPRDRFGPVSDIQAGNDEEEEEDEDEDEEEEEDGEDIERNIRQDVVVKAKSVRDIYTDGSSLSNGQKGAAAGIGVYFGPGDSRNISERLEGSEQTNQRAELQAIVLALEAAPSDEPIRILTDSAYSINCITQWAESWEKRARTNGDETWTNTAGADVKHQDLIKEARRLMSQREEDTTFEWVKGHKGNPGNTAADRLAVAGARKPKFH
jgi:ribonuclease HI